MARVSVLGLGSMGRRMALRIGAAGHDLTVWSRSGVPSGMGALEGRARPNPREAVDGAEFVISMVTDDEASRQVWLGEETGALRAVRPGALVIESSTLTPGWVSSLQARVRAAGARFLDAPVVGSRPQADAGALAYLVGGAAEDVERARPLLGTLGSAVHHLGPAPRGTVAKLAVNALFATQVAAMAELLGFARRGGIDPSAFLETLAALPVLSPAAKAAGTAICAHAFDPAFPVALAAKDLRYAAAAAEGVGAELPMTDRARELFERAVARGFGAENLTAVAKLQSAAE